MKFIQCFLFATLSALSGCNSADENWITVVVYPVAGRCAIKQGEQEQAVDCKQIATQLRDVMKLSADRQIDVSLSGSEEVSKEDRSVDVIAELIRKAGYRNVRAVRFGL